MKKAFKSILFLMVLICLFSCVKKPDTQNYSQADTILPLLEKPAKQDYAKTELKVREILAECNNINKLKLAKITIKFDQDESKCIDGREIHFYTYGGQLLKITDKGYFADDDWYFELFYQNNLVCFIYEETIGGSVSNKSSNQATYYFDKGTIIRMVENNTIAEINQQDNLKSRFAERLFNSFTDKDYPPVLCNMNY